MNIHEYSEKLLKLAEVAEFLHVHPNTIRRWSDQGKLMFYRVSLRGDRRYKKSDIDLFLATL